jgi:hypothetical protein
VLSVVVVVVSVLDLLVQEANVIAVTAKIKNKFFILICFLV